jgi:16S rRNA (guanine(1405)-N(7))-methyltransferase
MSELDQVVSSVASSKKYQAVCTDTIHRIAERELASSPHGNLKAAVKATKRRLHQVYGAFEGVLDYDNAIQRLEAAHEAGTREGIEAACLHVMRLHSSTRERLAILERFYPKVFEITGSPRSILDLGCGLNPLALPWMGLDTGAAYVALDIDATRIRFLDRYLAMTGLDAQARCQDILASPPFESVDVALLLKMSPSLERQEQGATLRLLEQLRTSFAVVSFAVKSLGGREKGMLAHYRSQFLELIAGRRWSVNDLIFDTELAFVLELGP